MPWEVRLSFGMQFDPSAVADQLLREKPGGDTSGLGRAELVHALNEAFACGKAAAQTPPELGEVGSMKEHFFDVLMESLNDFIYFKDRESRFIAMSQAHAKHFGVTPDEAVGRSDVDFFSEADAVQKRADEQAIVRTGKGWRDRVEHHTLNASGEERWALTSKHPWLDREGKIGGIFGHTKDITDKIQAERALEEQNQLFETLIDVLPCRIFIRDREHRFQLLNAEYRRSLGVKTNAEVIGKRLSELFDDPRSTALIEEDEIVMTTGARIMHRIEFDTSPVELGKWLSVAKVPLRNREGKIEGIVGVSFDVSAERQADQRARAANNELALQNR